MSKHANLSAPPLHFTPYAVNGYVMADPATGIAHISAPSATVWPGHSTCTIHIAQCPWACHYCNTPQWQTRCMPEHENPFPPQRAHSAMPWAEHLRDLMQHDVSAVIFSGGEPLSEPQLPALVRDLKNRGLAISLHTAGIYPNRLLSVLPLLDSVSLDIKTTAESYDALTGTVHSAWSTGISLALLLDATCTLECRTTWHPAWLSEADLLIIAKQLAERGVRHYTVQTGVTPTTAAAQLSAAAQAQLRAWFERFDYA